MCPFRPHHYKAEKKWKWIHLNLNGRQFNTCMHQVLLAAICTFPNSTPVVYLHNREPLLNSSAISVSELKPQHAKQPRYFLHGYCLHFFFVVVLFRAAVFPFLRVLLCTFPELPHLVGINIPVGWGWKISQAPWQPDSSYWAAWAAVVLQTAQDAIQPYNPAQKLYICPQLNRYSNTSGDLVCVCVV